MRRVDGFAVHAAIVGGADAVHGLVDARYHRVDGV